MDPQRRAFRTFLALHAAKARPTEAPVVHLQFCGADGALPPADAPLVALTREEVLEELDAESELVRWLLRQVSTYDCRRQRVIALVFDRRTVLSEVLHDPSELARAAAAGAP